MADKVKIDSTNPDAVHQEVDVSPELAEIIGEHHVDEVVLAYSDLSHEEVMHKASAVLAAWRRAAIAPNGAQSVSGTIRAPC